MEPSYMAGGHTKCSHPFGKKFNVPLLCHLATLFLGIYPIQGKPVHKDLYTVLIAVLFTMVPNRRLLKCPTGECEPSWSIHVTKFYLAMKKHNKTES